MVRISFPENALWSGLESGAVVLLAEQTENEAL